MLQRGLNDKSLPDTIAVELIAKANFQGSEVTTQSTADNKVAATISIHGADESGPLRRSVIPRRVESTTQ
jgi:hypothetical protein